MANGKNDRFDELMGLIKANIQDFKRHVIEACMECFDRFEGDDSDLRPAQRLYDLLNDDVSTKVHAKNFARWMLHFTPCLYDIEAKHFSKDKSDEANKFQRLAAQEKNLFELGRDLALGRVFDKNDIIEKMNSALKVFDNAKKWTPRNRDSVIALAKAKSIAINLAVVLADVDDNYDIAPPEPEKVEEVQEFDDEDPETDDLVNLETPVPVPANDNVAPASPA